MGMNVKDKAFRALVLAKGLSDSARAEALTRMASPGRKWLGRLLNGRKTSPKVRAAAAEALSRMPAPAAPDTLPADANRRFPGNDPLRELLSEVEGGAKPAEGKVWDDRSEGPKPAGDWKRVELPALRDANAPLPQAEPTKEQQLAEKDRLLRVSWEATSQPPDYTHTPDPEEQERKRRQWLSQGFSRQAERVETPPPKVDGEAEKRREWARLGRAGELNSMTIAQQMRLLGWKDSDEP